VVQLEEGGVRAPRRQHGPQRRAGPQVRRVLGRKLGAVQLRVLHIPGAPLDDEVAAGVAELAAEGPLQVQQVRSAFDCVADSLRRQRPLRPAGGRGRFALEAGPAVGAVRAEQEGAHHLGQARLVQLQALPLEPQDVRHLRVENRGEADAMAVKQRRSVLAAIVEHLDHLTALEHWREYVDHFGATRLHIYEEHLVLGRHLHQG